ncbi:MAG: hypothetical protein M5U12_13640 [Verrucomicrobia bacterium]|nr:hypothetical protein [Verrucomicrobiota bacterium]
MRAAVARLERLLPASRDGIGRPAAPEPDETALAALRRAADAAVSLDPADRLARYREARWLARALVLARSGISRQPLLFLQRNRFICQMLHEYMGYFYDYGKSPAGRRGFCPGETRGVLRGA